MASIAVEAATQEVIVSLVENGHREVAQLLGQHLASALRGDIGAMNDIIALAHVRALGDLSIASMTWPEWLGKLNGLRRRWQHELRATTEGRTR